MPLLIVEYPGPRRGAKMPPRVLIGRRSMNHLVIDHADVSRMHAWIDRVDGKFVLTDMRSRTATTVNGRVLPRSRALVDGDVIAIGPAKLTFLAGDDLPAGVEPFEIPRLPAISRRDVGVRFDCPHCRAPMWAAPQFAMHLGSCVYCGEEFVVPTGPAGPDGLAFATTVPPPAISTVTASVAATPPGAATLASVTAEADMADLTGAAGNALAEVAANLALAPSASGTLSRSGALSGSVPLLPPLDPLPPLFPPQLPEDAAAIVPPTLAARSNLPATAATDASLAEEPSIGDLSIGDLSSPPPKTGDGPVAPEVWTDGMATEEPKLRLVGEWPVGGGPGGEGSAKDGSATPASMRIVGPDAAETPATSTFGQVRPAPTPPGEPNARRRPEPTPTAAPSHRRDVPATGDRSQPTSVVATQPPRPRPPAPSAPTVSGTASIPTPRPRSAPASPPAPAGKAAAPRPIPTKSSAATAIATAAPATAAKASPAASPRRPGGVQVKPDAGTLAAAEGFNRVSPAPAPAGTATARAGGSSLVAPAVGLVAEAPTPAPGTPIAPASPGAALPVDFGARGNRPTAPAGPATVNGRADVGGNGHAKASPVGRRIDGGPAAAPSTTMSKTATALAEPTVIGKTGAPAPAAPSPSPAPAVAAPPPPARPPAPPDVAAAPKLRCGVCQSAIEANEARTTCPACGLHFHEECWQENYGCSAYGCSQVNVLAPPEPDAGADGATLDESAADAIAGDLSDVPPPPRKPWEFVLLGVSVLAAIAGAFTFGGAALAALVAAVVCLVRTRRDDDRRTAVVVAAAALSAAAVAAGAATSYFLFLYGRR